MEVTETNVIEIISDMMGIDKAQITRQSHFINDLNGDSLDALELVMEFEHRFDISIPDEDAERLATTTVGDVIDWLSSRSTTTA